MKLEPVWISSVEHIGKFAKLGIEAKRHALNWVEKTPQAKLVGITIFYPNGLEYPSKDLQTFPHWVNGSFPPSPIVLFASGELRILDERLQFRPRELRLKQGEFRELKNVFFELPVAHVMTLMRYKSPFSFDKRFNINWIRVVTTEDVGKDFSNHLGWLGRAFPWLIEKNEDAKLLGRDFLMCVGNSKGDMSMVYHRTNELYEKLISMKRSHTIVDNQNDEPETQGEN